MKKETSILCAILLVLVSVFTTALNNNDITVTPNETFFTATTVTFNITIANATESVVNISTILDGNAAELVCSNCSNASVTLSNLSEGQHNLVIFAHGNNSLTANSTVASFTVDTPPTAVHTAPSFVYSHQTTQNLNCSATDTTNLRSIKTVVWTSSGTLVAAHEENVTGTSNQTNFSYTFSEGSYLWNCQAADASNTTDWDDNKTLVIDTTLPDISSFTCSPSTVNKGESVTCTCSASDTNPITYTPGTTQNVATSVNGTFSVNCTVVDSAGNGKIQSASYTVNEPEDTSTTSTTTTTSTTVTNQPITKKTNSTNTTSQAKKDEENAAKIKLKLENTTSNSTEITNTGENKSLSGITGAVSGAGSIFRKSTLITLGIFLLIVIFIASFITFMRKRGNTKKKESSNKPKMIASPVKPAPSTVLNTQKPLAQNKFRKSTILD